MSLGKQTNGLLEVKEPIVLDEAGNPIFIPSQESFEKQNAFQFRTQSFSIQGGKWILPLAILFIFGMLTLGGVILGVAFLLFPIVWGIRALSRAFAHTNK